MRFLRLHAEQLPEERFDFPLPFPAAAQLRCVRSIVLAAGHLHVVHARLQTTDQVFLDQAPLRLGADAQHMALRRAEYPPRLAPFLVTQKPSTQVRRRVDIERLEKEREVAFNENIDAPGILRNSILCEGAIEQVALAAFTAPEMDAKEQEGQVHAPTPGLGG